jgi:hypothetical protein
MRYNIHSNPENTSYSRFAFLNEEDRVTDKFNASGERIPRGNRDLNARLSTELTIKYTNSAVSNFPSPDKNLFIVLGDGHINIKYSDGEEQICRNIYSPSDSWYDYQDIWNYSKPCYIELHGNVTLLRLILDDIRDLWQTKIRVINSEDDSLKTLSFSPSNQENRTLIHSPQFEFNAVPYSIYDRPVGLIKQFKNNKNITVKTKKYTTIIHSERI